MKLSITAIVLLLAASAAGGEVYKSVDSQGRVQYSDQPPSGKNSTKLNAPPAVEEPSAAAPAASLEAKELEFRKRRLDAEEKGKKDAEGDRRLAREQQNCTGARSQLRSLETGGRLSSYNEKSERTYLDDNAREAETAKARKAVEEWCK